ncbi:hypothetical protein GCM10020367_37950 [Streptomyces sannanensis]|uniref:Uncharacterized protein n=1 Tax=Streptomyces sannanensis TaxID=285536 RepID=A0ABP6SEK8_9ACTN
MSVGFLVDKSALTRHRMPEVAKVLDDLDDRGLLVISAPTEYEMVYSARTNAEATRLRT